MALSEIYGPDKLARALQDAITFEAFGCEYIANILVQREQSPATPAALHLTRRQDLLDLDIPARRSHSLRAQTTSRPTLNMKPHLPPYSFNSSTTFNCPLSKSTIPTGPKRPAQNWDHLDYLRRLIDGEFNERHQRTH